MSEDFENRIRALRGKKPKCTGVAARWCPNHGDCTCAIDWQGESTGDPMRGVQLKRIADDCPLHGVDSGHAPPQPIPPQHGARTGSKTAIANAIHSKMADRSVRTDQYNIRIQEGHMEATVFLSVQEQVKNRVAAVDLQAAIDEARPLHVPIELKIDWV